MTARHYREAGRLLVPSWGDIHILNYWNQTAKPTFVNYYGKSNRRNRCGWFANLNVVEYHNSKRNDR